MSKFVFVLKTVFIFLFFNIKNKLKNKKYIILIYLKNNTTTIFYTTLLLDPASSAHLLLLLSFSKESFCFQTFILGPHLYTVSCTCLGLQALHG